MPRPQGFGRRQGSQLEDRTRKAWKRKGRHRTRGGAGTGHRSAVISEHPRHYRDPHECIRATQGPARGGGATHPPTPPPSAPRPQRQAQDRHPDGHLLQAEAEAASARDGCGCGRAGPGSQEAALSGRISLTTVQLSLKSNTSASQGGCEVRSRLLRDWGTGQECPPMLRGKDRNQRELGAPVLTGLGSTSDRSSKPAPCTLQLGSERSEGSGWPPGSPQRATLSTTGPDPQARASALSSLRREGRSSPSTCPRRGLPGGPGGRPLEATSFSSLPGPSPKGLSSSRPQSLM